MANEQIHIKLLETWGTVHGHGAYWEGISLMGGGGWGGGVHEKIPKTDVK